MTDQLPEYIHSKIKSLSQDGDNFLSLGDYASARQRYLEAIKLLPSDHKNWNAATWLYVAIGDTYFHEGNFERSFMCFYNAVQCPDGLGNPFIHLRLGQNYFEKSDFQSAADELTRAYMGAGIDIFMEDDPKYLDFLETKIET